ncbi:MAG TPA: carboxymuconolactone decarboxylase family protein [Bryobacteraceae bacterium]|nr:carboxymuconolactone decarboxylase family protein [Bryobacteraceae bacterium]
MQQLGGFVFAVCLAATAAGQAPDAGKDATPRASALPADIHPDSLSRLPEVKRTDLDADGQRIYDYIAGPNKTFPPTGPAAVSIYSPKVAESIQMLNQYLRFHGVLSRRDTELAILVAAREFDQAYEWTGHEAAARNAGVDQSIIDVVKYGKDETGLSDKDTLIIRFGRQLFREHKLDSALFAKAVDLFGRQGTVEMATVMGDYAMAAIMLTAADQHLPADRKSTLPPR